MPLFKKAAIIGVGQIGGSLAWAIKKRRIAAEVVGVAKTSQEAALKLGAVHRGYTPEKMAEALKGADLVVLALPVLLIEAFLKNPSFTRLIDPKALIIDVGSTKSRICAAGRAAPLKKRFVGCHPMAGSEKAGAANANPDLFKNAVCFVDRAEPRVMRLWKAVGAEPAVLNARVHDLWTAHASHLPHLLAFLLFAGFPRENRFRANPSIRDLSRIAKSGPSLWAEIFSSNRKELLTASAGLEKRLRAFNRALRANRPAAIKKLVRESNRRSQFSFPADAR